MAAANYCLCDKCKAKTFYDSDVDYEDSNLGAMAALCKDCAQTHEITIAKRGEVAELRAALRRCSNLIQDFLDFGIAPVDRGPARHAVEAARAALAAPEGRGEP